MQHVSVAHKRTKQNKKTEIYTVTVAKWNIIIKTSNKTNKKSPIKTGLGEVGVGKKIKE